MACSILWSALILNTPRNSGQSSVFKKLLQDQLLQSAHAAAEELLAESLTSALAKRALHVKCIQKSPMGTSCRASSRWLAIPRASATRKWVPLAAATRTAPPRGGKYFVCMLFFWIWYNLIFYVITLIMLRHKQTITKYMYGKMKQNAVSKNQNHEWSTWRESRGSKGDLMTLKSYWIYPYYLSSHSNQMSFLHFLAAYQHDRTKFSLAMRCEKWKSRWLVAVICDTNPWDPTITNPSSRSPSGTVPPDKAEVAAKALSEHMMSLKLWDECLGAKVEFIFFPKRDDDWYLDWYGTKYL